MRALSSCRVIRDYITWLTLNVQAFKKSASLMQKDNVIIALELIGAISMEYDLFKSAFSTVNGYSVSTILFGLECWREAMTLRYFPTDG